jgi:molybdopterin/thiamine biosynthesis adenylyltransferase
MLRRITLTTTRSNPSRHHCAIQDKDEDFYLQFQIVICGLDSVEARRWMNATLVNMVDWDDPERTLKPLIDGGTEGTVSKYSFISHYKAFAGRLGS